MAWTLAAICVGPIGCRDDRSADDPKPPQTATTMSAAPSATALRPAASAGLRPFRPGALAGTRLLLDKADRQTDQRIRFRMAAGILAELEAARLPKHVVAALAATSERRVEVAQRAKAVREALVEAPAFLDAWNRSCDAGPFLDGGRIVILMAPRERDERKRAAMIFGLCSLAKRGLVGIEQLSRDVDALVLAHAIEALLIEKGGVVPEETRALKMLALGGRKIRTPIQANDLPTPDVPKQLVDSAAGALAQRVKLAKGLLDSGATKAFFEQVVHPHELGGVKAEEAARVFEKGGKIKTLRDAFRLAGGRPAVDEGGGEASVRLPWRPGRLARERLRFQLYEGSWYLRL